MRVRDDHHERRELGGVRHTSGTRASGGPKLPGTAHRAISPLCAQARPSPATARLHRPLTTIQRDAVALGPNVRLHS